MRLLWSIEHGLQKMSKRMESNSASLGLNGWCFGWSVGFRVCRPGNWHRSSACTPAPSRGFCSGWSREGCLNAIATPVTVGARDCDSIHVPLSMLELSSGTVEKAVSAALDKAGVTSVRTARRVLGEVAQSLNEFR